MMKMLKTKKLWALAAAAIVLAGCSSPTGNGGGNAGPAVIASAAITVATPVTGGVQGTTATVGAGANFTVGAVTWSPERDRYFYYNYEYTATVTLTASAGHTFTGGLATATINGQAATVTNNTGAAATLVLEFPLTYAPPAVIASAAITVTAPVTGATPATTATAGADVNFTVVAVTWSPADNPFEGETAYTATVTLTASAGHTFTGGLATATINEETATVTNNTGATVTLALAFAATAPAQDPVIAAWQFGTAEGDGPANNPLVSASIEDGNASRPSSGQQAETARLRFWVSPEGELTQRALNAGSSGINVLNAAIATVPPVSGGLDGGLAGNAWWETAISTTDRTDIAVTWRMRSTGTAPRDWRLQYRVGGTGVWNNVGGTIALSTPTTPANTLNEPERGRFLPESAQGHERLYLRWLMTSNVSVNGGTIAAGGTHQINDLVIRSGADLTDIDNQDDPTGTFTITWTGFTNPLLAQGVTITRDATTGVISINAPEGAFTSIQWLNDNLAEIGTGATLDLHDLPPLVTVRVRTVGSTRTYGIVFDTVTGNVF